MNETSGHSCHFFDLNMPFLKSYILALLVLGGLFVPSIMLGGSVDELWRNHDSAPNDSSRVKILLDIGYELEWMDPDSALVIYKMAADLGSSSNYKIGEGRALMYSGIVKSNIGDHEASLYFYDKAQEVFSSIDYQLGIAGTHLNKGVVYNYRGEYEKAMSEYITSIRMYEALNAQAQLLNCYGNVGGIFMELKQYKKGREYFLKEMQLAVALADSSMLADAYNNIALSHQMNGNIDPAIVNYKLALEIAEEHNSIYVQFLANNNLADVFAASGNVKEALPHSIMALKYAHEVGNPYNILSAYKNLGARYLELEQFTDADLYLDSAIYLGSSINSKDMLAETYLLSAESKAEQNDFGSAYRFQNLHKVYADSVFSEQRLHRLNELEVAYESEKKDHALAEQELDLERSRSRQKLTVIIMVILALAIVFMILYFHQKQKLKNKKFETLKKAQEINSIRAMMEGEEKERRRIARDLHDGLSALLASVKMKFSVIKKGNEFDQAMGSLDQASKEVRRIAHNMMPEVLLNYGLIAALKDFTDGIGSTDGTSFKIDLQYFNMEVRLEKFTELMIYRVIQELINNIVKHAHAQNVLVQLSRVDNILTITVEDDGKGFNVEEAMKKNGIGMANLRSRIDFLEGDLSIESSSKNGTSVHIELLVNGK